MEQPSPLRDQVALITGDSRGIGKAVAFLCSDEAEMIRGQIIVVDGSMSHIVLGKA